MGDNPPPCPGTSSNRFLLAQSTSGASQFLLKLTEEKYLRKQRDKKKTKTSGRAKIRGDARLRGGRTASGPLKSFSFGPTFEAITATDRNRGWQKRRAGKVPESGSALCGTRRDIRQGEQRAEREGRSFYEQLASGISTAAAAPTPGCK